MVTGPKTVHLTPSVARSKGFNLYEEVLIYSVEVTRLLF